MSTNKPDRLDDSIEATDAAGLTVRAHFDEAVKSLHSRLADRERLIENHRVTVNGLQEQLNVCNVRIANEEAEKAAAHEEASGLKERNAALETKVSALHNKISPAENAHLQLNEAKADLEKTKRAFDSAQTDLQSKAEALAALTITNTGLGDQVNALQSRLQDMQKSKAQSGPEQTEELMRQVREAEQRTRKEMADHIESFETQLKTKANNEVKRLTSERNRLEKQIKPLQEELASRKHQITQMQNDKSAAADALKQEFEQTKKHSQSLESEIEAMQSSLNDLEASSTANKGDQEKISKLSAQLNAEKTKLKQTTEQNAELLQQVKRLEQANEATELAKEQAQADLADLRKEKDSEIAVLQKERDEAKGAAQRAAVGLEHYTESCKKSIDDANEKADRKVQALHKQLSEAQADREREKEKGEEFRNLVEEKWVQEQQTFEEELAASNRKVAEAEARVSEADANAERRVREELQAVMDKQHASLQEELERERKRAETAEEKLESQHRPSGKDSKTSSPFKVPNIQDGATPSASVKSTAPSKPRKKANRNDHPAAEVGVIPAPKEIRRDSRRTKSTNDGDTTKGPVVEESQFAQDAIKQVSSVTLVPATLDREQGSFSSASDDNLFQFLNGSSQPLPLVVPETQFDDTFPSFAAVNRSLNSTQGQLPFAPSTAISASAKHEFDGIAGNGQSVSNNFTIYEDNHEPEQSSQLQYPRDEGHRLAKESWSQEEKAKYTYQPTVPQSNSGSKRVHSHDRHQHHTNRNNLGLPPPARREQDRYKTPVPDKVVDGDPPSRVQSSSNSTSPPAFMKVKSTNRCQSTYRTPGVSTGSRRLSQPNAGYITDPRLARRNEQAGTKRKADNGIVEGYEQERKKRLAVSANRLERNERRDQSQQPQSIKDLPEMSAIRTPSHTRMQHLAGGTSRPTKPTRKTTKSKFSQPNTHASS